MTKEATKERGRKAEAAPARRCAICGKPARGIFCSARCANIDLNRWLAGVYVVPGKAEEDEDGEQGPAPGDAS
jgi:endogenous inhibitor of DNA gyrase (YacG/DUF329 family)